MGAGRGHSDARTGFALPALPERLETERLVLRLWSPDDAPLLHEALGESVDHLYPWIPWATGRAPDPAQAVRLLEGWLGQRTRGENVIYAIVDPGGRLVGGVGAYARVGPGALELGYWLRASAAGQGYATEATGCLADAASTLPGVQHLEIHTDAANGASRRVAEKLGFHLAGAEGPRGGIVYVRARNPEEPRNAPPRPGVG